jgi:Tfp pilus assembly protein PilE
VGQQQLLLIILGTIVVAIAIAVAITMFQDNGVSTNRDAMQDDMIHLASKAEHYYRRPKTMGGGSESFVGLTADADGMSILVTTEFSNNDNGTYTILTAGSPTAVVFQAVGKTALSDGSFPTYTMTVTRTGYVISKVN